MCACGYQRFTVPLTSDMDDAWAEASRLYADEIAEWAELGIGIAHETWPES